MRKKNILRVKYILHEVRPGYHRRIRTGSLLLALAENWENEHLTRYHVEGEPCQLCDRWESKPEE